MARRLMSLAAAATALLALSTRGVSALEEEPEQAAADEYAAVSGGGRLKWLDGLCRNRSIVNNWMESRSIEWIDRYVHAVRYIEVIAGGGAIRPPTTG
jgi:hypothetical protein